MILYSVAFNLSIKEYCVIFVIKEHSFSIQNTDKEKIRHFFPTISDLMPVRRYSLFEQYLQMYYKLIYKYLIESIVMFIV